MKIFYQCGPLKFGINCFVCNSLERRLWPLFEDIEPPALLAKMAGQLFTITDSQELIIPVSLLDYCSKFICGLKKIEFDAVHLTGGEEGDCHFDCCQNFNSDKHRFYAGFSKMYDKVDGCNLLSFHSFLFLIQENILLETTPIIRDSYWGKALDQGEVAAHCRLLTNPNQKIYRNSPRPRSCHTTL